MNWTKEMLIRLMNKYGLTCKDISKKLNVSEPFVTYLRTGSRSLDNHHEALTAYHEALQAGKVKELETMIEYYKTPVE